jgi:hypothetical protein
MKAAVCTLFEKHYHLGAAVLVNSLCRSGFNGTVYAGFRGPLPPWAQAQARPAGANRWEMEAAPGVRIVFLKLETTAHFTNYKPDFLLQLEAIEAGASDAVIYCDPDIVLTGKWTYVEEWLSCGVALCEDVNSPYGENHPRRVGWRRFFQPLGQELHFRGDAYVNGGFIGLRWQDRRLLSTWQAFTAQITTALGGADVVGIGGGRNLAGSYGFADCFRQPDQDALNAALEACPDIAASILPREAMGFTAGNPLLPHALGARKPWLRRYIREALGGRGPFTVDKAFWKVAHGPLQPFTPAEVSSRRFQMTAAAAVGRFIRRT